MKENRFDAHVRVESILVEENRAARIVGHVKSFLKEHRDQHSQMPVPATSAWNDNTISVEEWEAFKVPSLFSAAE